MSSNSTASKLEELRGLASAKNIVRGLIASQSDTHALLFYGLEGSGKSELAQILAELWLCLSPSASDGADGTCRACSAMARQNNPDLLLIQPSGAGNLITIDRFEEGGKDSDQVLPLSRFLRTGPLLSRNKVVIVTDAHRMHGASSNALLKTLEEPPPFAKLVLTTTSTGSIRSTILSRTVAISCSLPSRDEVFGLFPSATEELYTLAEGSPGRMKRILASRAFYEELLAWCKNLKSLNVFSGLAASEELRGLVERQESKEKIGTRQVFAEALFSVATTFAKCEGFPPSWSQKVIVAHDRIIANVNATFVLDSLCMDLLGTMQS